MMTNKLPVVGKRYRATELNEAIPNKDFVFTCDEILQDRVIFNKEKNGSHFGWPIIMFSQHFEELPDSNPQETSEVDRALEELTGKTNQIIDELFAIPEEDDELYSLTSKAQNLVNALEAEKKHRSLEQFCGQKINRVKSNFENLKAEDLSKPEPKIDMKEERVEPVSIWKDVSELKNEEHCYIYLRNLDGGIVPAQYSRLRERYTVFHWDNMVKTKASELIWLEYYDSRFTEYCLLTDFVNQQTQMQKDIEELKKK